MRSFDTQNAFGLCLKRRTPLKYLALVLIVFVTAATCAETQDEANFPLKYEVMNTV
jgi:hypothetical protein